jgi:hypothetical protein
MGRSLQSDPAIGSVNGLVVLVPLDSGSLVTTWGKISGQVGLVISSSASNGCVVSRARASDFSSKHPSVGTVAMASGLLEGGGREAADVPLHQLPFPGTRAAISALTARGVSSIASRKPRNRPRLRMLWIGKASRLTPPSRAAVIQRGRGRPERTRANELNESDLTVAALEQVAALEPPGKEGHIGR